jgi:hypothetical protein
MFMLPAAMVWPIPIAFAASFTGAISAATVGFLFARYTARDWVSKRIPLRFRHLNEKFDSAQSDHFVKCSGSEFMTSQDGACDSIQTNKFVGFPVGMPSKAKSKFADRRPAIGAQACTRVGCSEALVNVMLIRLVLFEAPWCHWLLGISKVRL